MNASAKWLGLRQGEMLNTGVMLALLVTPEAMSKWTCSRARHTPVAVAVAQAHVQQRNLVHLVHRQVAGAALLTVTLGLHIRLHDVGVLYC